MSRKLIYSLVAVAIVLLAVFAIPNLVPARFASSGEPIAFKVRVVSPEGGAPIRGALVQIKWQDGLTDADGYCNMVQRFPARGTVGRSGECSFSGTLRVTAPGFSVWEQELASLFGQSYDYFSRGTQIMQVVTLRRRGRKSPPPGPRRK